MNEEKTMKCCICGKDVVLKSDDIPATWFAVYHGWEPYKAVHAECSRKPEHKGWWKD
jgi:hypothetical protein